MRAAWLLPLLAALLRAQYASAPEAYSVTGINSLMGPAVSMKIYRDGTRAALETSGTGFHTYSIYDLAGHTVLSWTPGDSSVECSKGGFGGDWGDPFAMSAELSTQVASQRARQVGSEAVNGFTAKVVEATGPDGTSAKAWVEPKYGLIVKLVMAAKTGEARTMLEIQTLTVGKPPAAVFAPPASCAVAAGAPAPPTAEARIAAETGGNPADYAKAIMPPASANSCDVLLHIVHAGTMDGIFGGVQIAIDRAVDPQHMPHYVMSQAADGHMTFSGGGLREVTQQYRDGVLRIDAAPAQFDIEVAFAGSGGSSSALIYRQCYRPETVLLMVVKNPQKASDGVDWLWAKSVKFVPPKL
jgi:hypothetical protein